MKAIFSIISDTKQSFLLLVCFLCTTTPILANPFAIQFPPKEYVTDADYIEIQRQLRAIDITPLIITLHEANQIPLDDFWDRCSRGIRRVLIDPDKGLFPVTSLEKIGRGSDRCIVCCAPHDGIRSRLLKSIAPALEASGFNGYFYSRIGGFPNPTGKEIQYVGVPYCFKIFMMLEAEKLGFKKVLWIDSACLPVRDPTPLFDWLELTGIYYQERNVPNCWQYIFPATQKILKERLGVDVLHTMNIAGALFGLKMNTAPSKRLIKEYYQLVEMGTPFLSCFPEEFVLSAIIAKLRYPNWQPSPYKNWLKTGGPGKDTPEKVARIKAEGYFFYHCRHAPEQ